MACCFTDTSHENTAIMSNMAGFHYTSLDIPCHCILQSVKFSVGRMCVKYTLMNMSGTSMVLQSSYLLQQIFLVLLLTSFNFRTGSSDIAFQYFCCQLFSFYGIVSKCLLKMSQKILI